MKTPYKYFIGITLSSLVGFSLSFTANAQHRDGGGSSSSSSGGSRPASSPAPAPAVRSSGGFNGNNAAISRPPVSQGSGFRPTYNNGPRPTGAPGQQQHAYFYPQQRNVTGVAPQTRGYVVPNGGAARIGAAQRPYVQGNISTYNNGNRVVAGHFSGGFANHGNYHYYHGYYGTYYAPRLGFSVGYLPYGYYPFYWGDYQYFYSGGLYYQYENNSYTVVEPPVGAEVKDLPSNAQSIVINGQQYYESNGVYYEPVVKDDGTTTYQIAGKDGELNTTGANVSNMQQAPQIGDIVQALPQDCRKIKLNGVIFYVSQDGYYYQDALDNAGNKVYKIVGTPNDEPQQ